MKMFFNMTIDADKYVNRLFEERLEKNPHMQTQLVRAFAQILVVAMGLRDEDLITVTNFNAGRIEDPIPENQEKPQENEPSQEKEVIVQDEVKNG